VILERAGPIGARLATGVLARRGGIVRIPLLGATSAAALEEEAERCRAHAEVVRVTHHDGEEHRGGNPDRWLESAAGGARLRSLYSSAVVSGLLARLTGVEWTPSGADGTYSYYCRPGHHLGIHRDVDECDLAVILCVGERWSDDPGLAGTLCVYPGRTEEPLSAIRAEPERGSVHARLRPGEAAIILGGIVPHRVLPVGGDHVRIVAPLCFTAVA
jgi:hypothetical protein